MSAHGVGRRDMGASRDAAFTRRIQNAFARPHAPTNSPAVSVMGIPTAIKLHSAAGVATLVDTLDLGSLDAHLLPFANEPALHLGHHPQHGHEDRSHPSA